MNDISLFNIELESRKILDEIAFNEGEISENDAERIKILDNLITKKTDDVASYRQSLCEYLEVLDNRKKELSERIDQINKRINKFDDYVNTCLVLNEKTCFEGEIYKITKRKPSKVVRILDEKKIPIEFIKIPEPKPAIMLAEIKEKLKKGVQVDGAILEDSDKISLMYKFR
jgi:hypothetical protein